MFLRYYVGTQVANTSTLFTVDNLMRLPLAFGITYMTSPAVFFPPLRRLPSTVTAELLYLKQKAEYRIPRLDSENPT